MTSPEVFSAEELAAESWRPVPGYPFNDASTLGRVRGWRETGVKKRMPSPRIIAPRPTKSGYLTVAMRNADGKQKTRRLQHVILETFVGPRPAGTEARHYPDRSKSNNRPCNLSWSTHVDNIRDKFEHGTIANGERNGGGGKLVSAQVMLLRYLRAVHGVSYADLGIWFGVSAAWARVVALGRKWHHLPLVAA